MYRRSRPGRRNIHVRIPRSFPPYNQGCKQRCDGISYASHAKFFTREFSQNSCTAGRRIRRFLLSVYSMPSQFSSTIICVRYLQRLYFQLSLSNIFPTTLCRKRRKNTRRKTAALARRAQGKSRRFQTHLLPEQ